MAKEMLVTGSEVSRAENTIARMGRAYVTKPMNVFVITSCIIVTMEMANGEANCSINKSMSKKEPRAPFLHFLIERRRNCRFLQIPSAEKRKCRKT